MTSFCCDIEELRSLAGPAFGVTASDNLVAVLRPVVLNSLHGLIKMLMRLHSTNSFFYYITHMSRKIQLNFLYFDFGDTSKKERGEGRF